MVVQPLLTQLWGQGAHYLPSQPAALWTALAERGAFHNPTPPVTCKVGTVFHHPLENLLHARDVCSPPTWQQPSDFVAVKDQRALIWNGPRHEDPGPQAARRRGQQTEMRPQRRAVTSHLSAGAQGRRAPRPGWLSELQLDAGPAAGSPASKPRPPRTGACGSGAQAPGTSCVRAA